MAGDLGAVTIDVHAKAQEVLGFWFALTPEQKFAKLDGLDSEIASRFGEARDMVLATRAQGWRDAPETLLAAVILLDQFSRNIHRGSAEAFAADALALALSREAMAKGWDTGMSEEQRQFLYLPLEHAEDPAMQALSVEKLGALSDPEAGDYARQHEQVIARFGRFPSRNEALGRVSTPEEKAYLSKPGAGW